MVSIPDTEETEPIKRLSRDLLEASANLGRAEVRYIVDGYYSIQEYRKAANNQAIAANKGNEPSLLLEWLAGEAETIEGQIKRAMKAWSESRIEGRWLLSQKGIGPVLSAGLLAHLDITKCACPVYSQMDPIPPHNCPGLQYAGHFWSFAGIHPAKPWLSGTKRPWNADLKTLCWKIGQSFMKVSGGKDAFYGIVYRQRKEFELANAANHPEQVAEALARPKLSENQHTYYDKGLLPPGRIEQRAERYAVHLFLAHLHHVMYETTFGKPPPMPYVIDKLGHTQYLAPPNWPMA